MEIRADSENDRQATAGMGSTADQIDAFEVVKAIPWPQVQHLPKVVSETKSLRLGRSPSPPSRPA